MLRGPLPHRDADGLCEICGEPFPCPTGVAIFEALKRELFSQASSDDAEALRVRWRPVGGTPRRQRTDRALSPKEPSPSMPMLMIRFGWMRNMSGSKPLPIVSPPVDRISASPPDFDHARSPWVDGCKVINDDADSRIPLHVAVPLALCEAVPTNVDRVGLRVVAECQGHNVWLPVRGGRDSPEALRSEIRELRLSECAHQAMVAHDTTTNPNGLRSN